METEAQVKCVTRGSTAPQRQSCEPSPYSPVVHQTSFQFIFMSQTFSQNDALHVQLLPLA